MAQSSVLPPWDLQEAVQALYDLSHTSKQPEYVTFVRRVLLVEFPRLKPCGV
jgi:hypothetical protein